MTAPVLEVRDLHVRFSQEGALVHAVKGVSVDVGRQVVDAASSEGFERAREVLAADVLRAPPASTLSAAAVINQVTVAMETPAAWATCRIVTFSCRVPPGSLACTAN